MTSIRAIAIHLPQFHPIQENNDWWGTGFTEWVNVTKARPLFSGHYQPQLPSDLGFYDLRLEDSRVAQEQLAKAYGVEGFCYYHYWFNGRLLLERPIEEKLRNPKEDLPFMLCWANENWTRRWDGMESEVLMHQEYSEQDDVEHFEYLIKYFEDDRYIKVDGKPVLILYKPFLLPDPSATAMRWRKLAADRGFELYLCHMVFGYRKDDNKLLRGFDAAIDFEPFGTRRASGLSRPANLFGKESLLRKIKRKLEIEKVDLAGLHIYEYRSMFENIKSLSDVDYKMFPSLVPGWDNTARRQRNPTLVLHNSSPELFRAWLNAIVDDFRPYSPEENFVFINAWNEWAEGNHLEPCVKWGRRYLEVVGEFFAAK